METKWPRISIVTPSLNQGNFIETTIQSVLSQKYPNLEYLIIDGGSTDDTLSILNSFNRQVKWISEKDNGQTDAINKGLRLVTGEIVAYLNADDVLLPGSLVDVAKIFMEHPEVQWLTGRCKIIDDNGVAVRGVISLYKNLLLYSSSFRILLVTNYISQPATFWCTEVLNLCGLFDSKFNYVMDYDYWLRIWKKVDAPYIYHQDLAGFRIQRNSKTTSSGHLQDYVDEERLVVERYSPSKIWNQLHNFHRILMTNIYRFINR
ncbi:MAG: glycosyltransferase family 2 protein [Anaerolineales bacterium]